MYQQFYSKLIRCIGTYFLKEICQYINVRINYFFFIIRLNFLFLTNLFADFDKIFKCRLFNKNARKSTENVCEQWEIAESTNWKDSQNVMWCQTLS